ncbi:MULTISPECIES: AbrB/MazE/SpoVT family DNA-binding domain-containing protein [Ciceribacter]|uniref:AbrB family transcriptional regulator n=1 Tax=Ciceribacter lividus TaxID=1197950 RepID=A0A6I7HIN5_9HYPH|nr:MULTISPECIES: AbrB/MazE/SpoVT family DNA-binding domain-containing protein [Ciceribacter]MCO6179891.1 AbrB/MazE/SpoVT family DNA-binding domain-containing protein [Ciceribacter sp. RN22]RCW21897.1 AbrB family transcriptional regulator [Ciceribacter lividus]
MGALTTMTSKGQLTIPKDVRDQLNLAPGTRFYVTVRNGQVVATPKNKKLADLAGVLGKPPFGAGMTAEDMDEAIMDAAAEDDARITREWHEGRK